jgi:hypothetical protein
MAFWQTSGIININDGNSPNDGTGDTIRNAFIKVGYNFANVSSFLAQSSIDFQSANIELNLNSTSANVVTLTSSNIVGGVASFTSNVTTSNVIVNGNIYSTNNNFLRGNTTIGNLVVSGVANVATGSFITGNVTPVGNLQYNLGSPTNFFKNLYVGTLNQINQVSLTASASMLELQSNVVPGSVQDVGILGKYSLGSGAAGNAWSFFGQQYSSNAFIYVTGITSDLSQTTSIVSGGVYGNAHFGSQWLSNTTSSTSTTTGALIVAGGVGVVGNVNANVLYGNLVSNVASIGNLSVSGNVSGNLTVNGGIYSGGYPVIVASPTFVYGTPYTGGVISGNAVFLSTSQSTSYSTGAVTIPNGGLGVGGSIYSAGGFYGQLTGVVATASQPFITSLGQLTSLSMAPTASAITGNLQATTIGVGTLTASSVVVTTSLTGLSTLNVGGTISASIVTAGSVGNVGTTQFTGANLTLTNTLTTSVVNAVTIGNVGSIYIGNGGFLSNIQSANVSLYQNVISSTSSSTFYPVFVSQSTGGNLQSQVNSNLSYVPQTGTLTASNLAGILTTAAQTNITSVGVLNGLTTSANIYPNSNILVNLGGPNNYWGTTWTGSLVSNTVTVASAITPSGNLFANIGSSTNWFRTIFGQSFVGTSSTAQYADLAEMYLADSDYGAGTVVVVGGDAEVTACAQHGQDNVIGVVSTDPAYKMNSGLAGGTYIALKGRVPVKVFGPIQKGQRLSTSAEPGHAEYAAGAYSFAIALETNNNSGAKTIEAIIL